MDETGASGEPAVFLADGQEGYVKRLKITPARIEEDGKIYVRYTMEPLREKGIAWHLYAENEPGGPTCARALQLLRDFLRHED